MVDGISAVSCAAGFRRPRPAGQVAYRRRGVVQQLTDDVDASKRYDAFYGPLQRCLVMQQVLHKTIFHSFIHSFVHSLANTRLEQHTYSQFFNDLIRSVSLLTIVNIHATTAFWSILAQTAGWFSTSLNIQPIAGVFSQSINQSISYIQGSHNHAALLPA